MVITMLLLHGLVTAQRMVKGSVTDKDGVQLIGASIVVKNAVGIGTVSDEDGKFELEVPGETTTLVISYIGYNPVEAVIGNDNIVNVSLQEGSNIEEIVVVGYGTKSTRFNTQSVATLSERTIQNKPVLSPQELLQGQAAGVQMVNSSGVLGANSSIRIRGAASITGGGQPLFVVDGVPLNDDVRSTFQGGGTGLNPLMNINANEIESMSVLKDAAAVAIYGSRGSNGVVLIKTKKGKHGEKTQVSADYFTGMSEPTNVIKMMNTQQFNDQVNSSRVARGLAAQTLPTDYFDWPSAVLQTGKTNNANVSVRGGTDKTTYYLGAGYIDESGFTIGNESKRLSGRINFEHRATDRLKIGSNLSISDVDMNRIGVENNTFAPLTSAYLQLPNVLPRNPDGTQRNTGFIQNVLAIEELNTNFFGIKRSVGNLFVDFQILDGLTFRSDWGIDRSNATAKTRNVNLLTPGGSASRDISNDEKWLTTNTINYTKEFGKHSIGALVGLSYETSSFLNVFVSGNGFASDDLPNVISASTPTATQESTEKWALESQFVRANYNLSNKYLIEGTVRRDGSSRFGANNKYGIFWAVSGGWIASQESFLRNSSVIDFLKLTASYGTAGNDRIGNFSSLALYGGGVASDYLGTAGLRPTQTPNADLTWEETTQTDIGLTTKLFNEFIDLSLNWYDKRTAGILLNVPYPFTTGFPSASQNIGKMQNTGFDIDLSFNLVKKSNFNWSLGLDAGFLTNKVLELPNATKDADGNRFITGSGSQRAVEGRTLNEFFMVRAKGVNPQTGDFEWLDKTGNPTTTYSANNRVFVGTAIPKWVGGINTNLNYGNLDFSALVNFSQGNKVLISGLGFTDNVNSPGFNKSVDLLNWWKESGDNAFVPKLSSPTAALFNQTSTLQLQNGSFLRLRNVTLGYSIPAKILSRTNIVKSVRLFAMGQNLFLLKDKKFRGPDPEVSANGPNNLIQGESFFALPQAKTITGGINIQF